MPEEEAPLPDPVSGEPVIDYRTGEPFQMTSVPGWLPKPFDNPDIVKSVLENWMKTSDWDELDPERQTAALLVYKAVLDIESKPRSASRTADQMAEQAGAVKRRIRPASPRSCPRCPSLPLPATSRNPLPPSARVKNFLSHL
jgi:hypothetical protein